MSEAGRRRPARTRPATRLGARTTAALTVLTLGAAVAVPVAVATGDRRQPERTVRGAAAGALLNAPTDQIRAREWHLEALRTQKAWKYSKGRGVTVAVLDTGVDKNHPDLTGQVLTGPDLTGGVRSPGTRYWGLHGTSMASIISGHGHGPRLSQGMMGVAPQSHILSIRVTLENDDPLRRDNGQGGSSDRDAVAQGIRYAVDHGADIINMSLGGGRQFYNGTKSQESAIKYALDKGVVLIASAGNDGSGANRKNFPAAYPGVIAVGALDRRLRLWKDSNRRSHAAVCAPGVDIVSADASNGYVVGTGTSASSAMVAGVAALVRSRYPRLTPAEVREALIQGSPARRGRPTGSSTCQGTVDALLTLFAAHKINKTSSGPVEAPPPSPSPEPVTQVQGEGSDLLLPLVLAGGGLLVVLGLVLGWRQRRRPEDDTGDTDAVPDYGLPSAPPAQRHPAAAVVVPRRSAAVAPVAAPVNAPLWQSTDVYQGPPAPAVPPGNAPPFEVSPFDVPPYDVPPSAVPGGERSPWDGTPMDEPPIETPSMETPPMDTSWGSTWDTEAPPDRDEPPPPAPHQPPIMSSELRPFVPGEYSANGRSGGHANGQGHLNGHGFTNGHKPANGHDFGNGHHDNGNGAGDTDLNGADLNGSGVDGLAGDDVSGLDDDDWEAFRRNALDGHEPPDIGLTAPLPAVPPEPPAQPPPPPGPPVPPVDEWPTGALPAVPPDPADGEPPRGPVPPMDQADDEPRGRHSRRSGPSDDEDYRPPWW